MWLSAPLLLLLRQRWVPMAFGATMLGGAGLWGSTAISLVRLRMAQGIEWQRMAIILAAVALLTAFSPLLLRARGLRERYGSERAAPGLAAFLLTASLLGVVMQMRPDRPLLLLERFVVGGGWLTGFWLAVWAGWLAHTMQSPKLMKRWRPRIWLLFSVVFFVQLSLGLAGLERFLMTGQLHMPVPALIVAGPVYRGAGFFMPILFCVTVVLVGPAWCAWLCYIGAWDDRLARLRKKPAPLPRWRPHARMVIVVLVIIVALGLRLAGLASWVAVVAAGSFGLIGVALMVTWSRRSGAMAHCTTFCPIGFFATRLGRLSPLRIWIGDTCNQCGACTKACRYDALSPDDVDRRRVGEACTLCGDCVGACAGRNIDYQVGWKRPWLRGPKARQVFVVLVAWAHAVFLGVARM